MERGPKGAASARAALSEAQWDALLDGEPHQVDLSELIFTGGISGFRSAVYREAEKRYGWAKTKRLDVFLFQVQGFDCRPDFARRHRASPVPWMALDPVPQQQGQPQTSTVHRSAQDLAPAGAFAEDYEPLTPEEEEALLGPCTCGQAPVCLPTCARAGG